MAKFLAMTGWYYQLIFLYLEPMSLVGPFISSFKYGGPAWFYNELVPPTGPPPTDLDPRTEIALYQLMLCYITQCLITTLGFRAIRDILSDDPAGQERFIGVILLCLGIADVAHIFLTFRLLPHEIKYLPHLWNTTTHGNITFVSILLGTRLAWYFGVGRKRYYFGQPSVVAKKDK